MEGLPALGSFDLKIGPVYSWGPTGSIAKVLTDVHENFWQKSTKWEVYLLWGSLDLENGPVCSWGPTGSITKVLTEVHENFWQKPRQNFGSPKIHGL
ncbi:hypothetical protein H5410_029242 [Solanum commersonii]|uniref:Uncharacterized protein n=1 Tax=Solanum commersonii TaxID=4109 RepID=A0A9J5Z9Z5_SOLCO|nr:hypothetical protein H5410_029242 [Solanum commersonii]